MSGALEILMRSIAVAVSDLMCVKIIEHAEQATAALAEKVDAVHNKVELLGQVVENIPGSAERL